MCLVSGAMVFLRAFLLLLWCVLVVMSGREEGTLSLWLTMSGGDKGALTLWLVVSGRSLVGALAVKLAMSDLLAAPSLVAGELAGSSPV